MHIYADRAGPASVAASAGDYPLDKDAAVRVHLEIAPVEHDTRACDAIVERDLIRPDSPGELVALEDAFPREVAKIGVFERAARENAQRADDAALHRKPRGANRAAHPIEVRPASEAVADVGGGVPLAVIAEAICADQAGGQTKPPAVPIGGLLRVGDDRIAALRAGSGIERDPGERRLRALGKAHGARPVVMAREPESVDRAVPDGGIEMIHPVVSWIRLGGSLCIEPAREQDCDGEGVTGSPHGAQVCSKTCAVS